MSISTNHQFTNTSQNSPMSIQDFVSFHLSSYNYQHGSTQSLSPVKR